MSKTALIIGVDNYNGTNDLTGCVNDAKAIKKILEENDDGTKNFEVKTIYDERATRKNVRKGIKELFKSSCDVALLYFSGHGYDDENDGFIVTHDFGEEDYGVSMPEILKIVTNSKIRNKILVFDCCYAGFAGSSGLIGDFSMLSEGLTIFTSSKNDEVSYEINGHGVFTTLFVQALEGAASDVLGQISIGSVYSFIDSAMGKIGQRPVFKTNVTGFVNIRQTTPKVHPKILRRITDYFKNPESELSLNPSFEFTNIPEAQNCVKPYFIKENGHIFNELQLFNRNSLVVPVDEEHMYFAAMNSKKCKLTPLGQYYWHLVEGGII
ncbi:MAG: caspase family protein [Candidatus Izemoplasmatales bacterium]|nr:caspase family protein [Candidatus Izemoplasmatales bacterium]